MVFYNYAFSIDFSWIFRFSLSISLLGTAVEDAASASLVYKKNNNRNVATKLGSVYFYYNFLSFTGWVVFVCQI